MENQIDELENKMGAEELPGWVNHAIEGYETILRKRQISGLVGVLYAIEEGATSLSEEQLTFVTERVMQLGMEALASVRNSGQELSDFYQFAAGNIAAYLQNVGHAFPTRISYDTHILRNLAHLITESKSPVAVSILIGCMEISRNFEFYKKLYKDET